MKTESYIFLTTCILVGCIDSSEQYGTKGGHKSFTQSFSSSSASAHSSSFSSSGSYSFGDKSVLPIIGPIPIAKSTAIASASAGAASAVAGASSSAAGHTTNAVGGSSVGISGSGSYGGGSSSQGASIQSGSYHSGSKGHNHGHNNPSAGFNNGQYSGDSGFGQPQEPGYGGSKLYTVIQPSGYGQTHTGSGSYGVSSVNSQTTSSGGSYGSHSTVIAGSKDKDETTILRKPPCCKPIPPGPNGSIHDYKVPSNVNTESQTSSGLTGYGPVAVGSGTYGGSVPSGQVPSSGYGQTNVGSGASIVGSQVSSTGFGQTTIGSGSYGGAKKPSKDTESGTTGRKPCCKGPFPGPNGSIYDSKPASAVGTAVKPSGSQEPIKPSVPLHRPPINFPGPSGSIYTSKPVKPASGVSGTYKPSYSVQPVSSSPGLSQHVHTNKPISTYQPSSLPGVAVGGYQPSGPALPSSPSISSNTILKPVEEYQPLAPTSIFIQPVSGTKPLGGGNNQYGYQSKANAAATSSANSYQTQYQGTSEYKPSCTQGGCKKESSITYQVVGGYQPSGPALPSSPSIPSNTISKPVEGYTPTAPSSTVIQTVSGVPSTKPLGGGINQYGSQSNANAGATGSANSYQTQYQGSSEYKPSCTQGGCKKHPSITYEIVGGHQPSGQSLPSSPSIPQPSAPSPVPSKPLGGGNIQYGYQSNVNPAATSSGNSYQTQYQGPLEHKTTCTGLTCKNEPPRTYLQPPQHQGKPITETVREQPIPQATPGTIYNGVKPQVPTTVDVSKQGSYGVQVSSTNNGYNAGTTSSVSANTASTYGPSDSDIRGNGYNSPQGPSYSQIKPQQIPTQTTSPGIQKQSGSVGYQTSTSTSSASSSSSSTHSAGTFTGGQTIYSHGVVQKPTVPTITIDNDKGLDQDRILYVSSPGSPGYVGGKTSGYSPSVTENTISGSGLKEGPRGSPYSPTSPPKYEGKTSNSDDYDGDAAIVFVDGQRGVGAGSYSSGRGYSSSSGFAYSGSGGSHAKGVNVYSTSNSGSPNKDLSPGEAGKKHTYTSTLYVDLNKPGKSGQEAIASGPGGQGVLLVGTSSGDNSKSAGGSYSFSGGYGGSSVGHKGIPCGTNGCGTSYRQYSNAVPSSGSNDVTIHIASIPSGSGSSYSSSGSYGGGSHGGYGSGHVIVGSTKGGSAVGSYGGSSGSSGSGVGSGGFLSSIFLDGGAAANSGSYGGAGSYSHSGSFSKSSSHASSSSFASSSSGSYSSNHY
ncbi:hornerin-like isoform X2 [Harmonia axyridis]|uniref:hornerin-like isoform X2 n=1 Tax=Harmonia axyridis TaxID=115357 RepID=UPI001E2771EB|nr:hornerin-like isoform X2 [Harmonia axyridis]